ncbi:hypothetical protein SCHPADRAFT_617065 [Schizopora paradoxa]|uniref:Uncharacterized protein n=1 Tax=Schizopora paradoxa TaxID=27342 RepID=A0A0H2RF63_9AGAM|nr:hypothetical protein SCHPADRAFT_617065 [Schizopora paradoxa]
MSLPFLRCRYEEPLAFPPFQLRFIYGRPQQRHLPPQFQLSERENNSVSPPSLHRLFSNQELHRLFRLPSVLDVHNFQLSRHRMTAPNTACSSSRTPRSPPTIQASNPVAVAFKMLMTCSVVFAVRCTDRAATATQRAFITSFLAYQRNSKRNCFFR